MKIINIFLLIFASLFANASVAASNGGAVISKNSVAWQQFDQAAFAQARSEDKYILLDLVAVWCHWCHVMEAETYADQRVAEYLKAHFVPVQADHDARPDLAERYRDWGWPATIILSADGKDIVKRAGYIAADDMLRLLQAVVDDPSPEQAQGSDVPEKLAGQPELAKDITAELSNRHRDSFDEKNGGLDIAMKFIDQDSILWSLRQIRSSGNAASTVEKKRLVQTLDAAKALIDPAFGGAYQYSTHGDWQHPHYEKIMKSQWSFLLSYSQACRALQKTDYCDSARAVAAYLLDFLAAEEGGFYTSQDADLKRGTKGHEYFALNRENRLKKGQPRIDKHRYAATNGMAIEGLSELYLATQDPQYLRAAETAAQWVIKNRFLWGGGFRHDQFDRAGPFLADTLFMGRAFLSLYRATGNQRYLKRALRSADFIDKQFRHPRAGLVAAGDNGTPLAPRPQIDQNIQAALWLLELQAESQSAAPLALANHIMRYLATGEIALARLTEAGILEANASLTQISRSLKGVSKK